MCPCSSTPPDCLFCPENYTRAPLVPWIAHWHRVCHIWNCSEKNARKFVIDRNGVWESLAKVAISNFRQKCNLRSDIFVTKEMPRKIPIVNFKYSPVEICYKGRDDRHLYNIDFLLPSVNNFLLSSTPVSTCFIKKIFSQPCCYLHLVFLSKYSHWNIWEKTPRGSATSSTKYIYWYSKAVFLS